MVITFYQRYILFLAKDERLETYEEIIDGTSPQGIELENKVTTWTSQDFSNFIRS